MPVVSAVIQSKNLGRGIGITEHAIKVDHIVIFFAGSDPRIDSLALDLLFGRKDGKGVPGVEIPRQESECSREFQSFGMGTLNELLIALNDLFDGDLLVGIQRKDVVAA